MVLQHSFLNYNSLFAWIALILTESIFLNPSIYCFLLWSFPISFFLVCFPTEITRDMVGIVALLAKIFYISKYYILKTLYLDDLPVSVIPSFFTICIMLHWLNSPKHLQQFSLRTSQDKIKELDSYTVKEPNHLTYVVNKNQSEQSLIHFWSLCPLLVAISSSIPQCSCDILDINTQIRIR